MITTFNLIKMTKPFNDNSEVTAISTQIEILKKHFPQCFDKHNAFMPDKLQALVSEHGTAFSKESYSLNWLGKSYARLLANENPLTFLSEDKVHNQKPENKNTENLLIKGDNLEVLKHLKSAYHEQIKMIYIDPPYNTGTDGFVYQDDRKFTVDELSRLAGIESDEAKRILDFTQSKANSHSAWLTFMYPRLYIARELLKDDGVIFISIDDNELSQLKLLCDNIFGEVNYIECICWNKRIPKNDKGIGNIHEYILLYSKDSTTRPIFKMRKDGLDDIYSLTEKLKRKATPISDAEKAVKNLYKKNDYDRGITLYNSLDDDYRLWGKINMSWPNAETFGPQYKVIHPVTKKPVKIPDRGWRWIEETFNDAAHIKNGSYNEINELHDGSFVCGKIWFACDENTQPSSITYLDEVNDFLLRSILSTKSDGGVEIESLFDGKSYFSYPKPTGLIKTLIGSRLLIENDICLDFFAGSGTTAHAVMALNAEQNNNIRCISVQIPELADRKKAAYKAGYKTIFDITKARIEKAAEKIKTEHPDYQGDLGFKIFETVPMPEGYLVDHEILKSTDPLFFNGSNLNNDQLDDLLTTWKVYDGIALTVSLNLIDLAGYSAYQHQKILYLIQSGFSYHALVMLLQKLDDTDKDKAFDIERLVLFAHNFDSKHQREIKEALTHYQNKKSKNISVEFRY